jgi:MFS family permease
MPKKPSSEAEVTNPAPIPAKIKDFLSNLVIVLLVGALIGIGMRLLMGEVLQRTLKAEIVGFTGLPIGTLSGSILIFQAVIALGTGRLSKVIDNKRLMMISFGVIAFGLGLLSLSYGAIASIVVIIFLLICVSAVNNGMVAFALTMVPKSLSGLTVGLFFGGLSGAIAIFGYLVPKPAEMISNSNVSLLTAIAFLSAGIAIAFGEKITRHLNVD